MSGSRVDAVLGPVLLAADEPLKWEDITPGLIGLLFVVLLGLATYGLFRSMNTQLKRVDAHFEEEDAKDAAAADAAAAPDVEPADDSADPADAPDEPEGDAAPR